MNAALSNYFSTFDANFRRFELPWTRIEEETTRFRNTLIGVMGVLLLLSLLIPFLPVQETDRNSTPEIPPRLAKLVLEKKRLPPPPPPVVKPEPDKPQLDKVADTPPPKPVPVVARKPVPTPKVLPPPVATPAVVETPQPIKQTREKAREKAKTVGLLAVADDLASLRQNTAIASTSNRSLSNAAPTAKRTERALITSKSGKRSAGVNTAALSRNTGGGGLAGRSSTEITSGVAQSGASASDTNSLGGQSAGSGSGSFAGQRSQEQIETIFDRNKAAIYALYRRALRKDPTLQGKLVLQVTIAASGKVVDCSVVSSELSSPAFESSLIKRVKMFDFGPQDVDEITTTKPIDFFPA